MSPGIMPSRLRKFVLTSHVTVSVGWVGAAAAYLSLAVVGVVSRDGDMARAAYRSMELIAWTVIIPSSLAALLTELVQALGTEWGLFRYYRIVAKLVLTTAATGVLLMHIPTVSRMARIAIATTLSTGDSKLLRIQLMIHAVGGLLVLLTATALSVYKPWGRIGSARARTSSQMSAT